MEALKWSDFFPTLNYVSDVFVEECDKCADVKRVITWAEKVKYTYAAVVKDKKLKCSHRIEYYYCALSTINITVVIGELHIARSSFLSRSALQVCKKV